MGKITAEIVGHSLSPQGDELISVLCTFPRIILAEVNTHRMLSKNTSSSRAIPFKKMVESVQNDPFIPIAWQKEHSGMQGTKYWTEEDEVRIDIGNEFEYIEDIQPITEEFKIRWLEARDKAVNIAIGMNDLGLTKQLCNRLLEPFMWTTMLITGSKEGWDNFFNLRCGNYDGFKSRKEASKEFLEKGNINTSTWSELDWLKLNKGQAEIHIIDLAEKIYDAVNESTPKQLKAEEWHIPFKDKIISNNDLLYTDEIVKISTAMAAHTSYTIVGGEAVKSYEKWIELHDKLVAYDPPHSSPMEHCARAMNSKEYYSHLKGEGNPEHEDYKGFGWCRNFKGFIPYRHIIETEKYGDI